MGDWSGSPEFVAMCLGNFRFHWGDAYAVDADAAGWDGTWTARRLDDGTVLTASNPRDLREAILADYAARPVPR